MKLFKFFSSLGEGQAHEPHGSKEGEGLPIVGSPVARTRCRTELGFCTQRERERERAKEARMGGGGIALWAASERSDRRGGCTELVLSA